MTVGTTVARRVGGDCPLGMSTSPLLTTDHALDNLRRLSLRVADAEITLSNARANLDEELDYWHRAGVPISQLARDAGLTRATIYKSLQRVNRGE